MKTKKCFKRKEKKYLNVGGVIAKAKQKKLGKTSSTKTQKNM